MTTNDVTVSPYPGGYDPSLSDNGLMMLGQGEGTSIMGQPTGPAILQRGVDPTWLLHSLRRHWLLATGLGLLVGAIISGIAWICTPSQATAVMLIKVAARQPVLLSDVSDDEADFQTLKRTQTELFKSHFVLHAALDQPGISEILSRRQVPDKIEWLRKNLDVQYPGNAQILSVSMQAQIPAEAKALVEAATKAFMSEVVDKERASRLVAFEALKQAQSNLQNDINRKSQAFALDAREQGTLDSQAVAIDRTMNIDQLNLLRDQKMQLEGQSQEEEIKIAMLKAQRDNPHLVTAQVDELVNADPQVGALREQISAIELQMLEEKVRAKRQDAPSLARLTDRRNALNKTLIERQAQVRPQVAAALANSPLSAVEGALNESRLRKTMVDNKTIVVNKEIDRLTTEIKRQGEQNVELEAKKAELEQLRIVAAEMRNKTEAWSIELNSPSRVTLLQKEATITPGIDKWQRYMMVAAGGLGGFALTAFGIAFWDFRSRKLNSPAQVDEGLGLQVLGELPPLSGPRGAAPSEAVVATLTESVDGIRTRLIHLAQLQDIRVIMVTSASGQEGSSTVSSQLAASLGRAGKRTLLIDADLRHPQIHRYFDLPQGDGLAEVLTNKRPVESVIRVTDLAGLWVITAGDWNSETMKSLAKEQLSPILKELSSEFDFIILDGAPVLNLTDSLLVGRQTDGVILATRRDVSLVPAIHSARNRLRSVGIRVLGAVVNGVKHPVHERASRMRLVLAAQDPANEPQLSPEDGPTAIVKDQDQLQ